MIRSPHSGAFLLVHHYFERYQRSVKKKRSPKDEVNLKINKSLLNTQLNTQRYSITKL